MARGRVRLARGTLAGVLLVLALVGCGGRKKADATATPAEPDPPTAVPTLVSTATPSPEPTHTLVPTPTATATPQPTPTPDPVIVDALADVALTLADMPAGWAETPTEPSDSDTGPCGNPDFDRKNNKLGEYEVQFQAGDSGPFVLQNLVEFPEGDAADAMAWAKSSLTCTEWTETDPNGAPVTYRLSPLEMPPFGDESFAARVEVDIAEVGTLTTDTVFLRVGTLLSIVGYSSIQDTDLDALTELAATAAKRMATFEQP